MRVDPIRPTLTLAVLLFSGFLVFCSSTVPSVVDVRLTASMGTASTPAAS